MGLQKAFTWDEFCLIAFSVSAAAFSIDCEFLNYFNLFDQEFSSFTRRYLWFSGSSSSFISVCYCDFTIHYFLIYKKLSDTRVLTNFGLNNKLT